jgi:sterol desaturase/sphingolipid hydroxylase (fatty acid hydroxylase superfamily)
MRNALGVFVYLGSYGVVAAIAWTLYQHHLLDGWFLVLVWVAGTGFTHLLSLLWPRNEFHEARSEVLLQTPILVFGYLTNHYLVRPVSLALAWWIASLAPFSWNSSWTIAMRDTSPLVLILGCLIFHEAMGYLHHRIFHAIPKLWQITHSVHHELRTYGPALSIRVHHFEYFTMQMTRFLIFAILQVEPLLILIMVSLSSWSALLMHANTCLRFGWINYIMSTSETHVWHHDMDKRVNYSAGVFSIFDWLGGTFYYRPNEQPARLGVSGISKPRTFRDIVLCRPPNLDAPSVVPSGTPVKA